MVVDSFIVVLNGFDRPALLRSAWSGFLAFGIKPRLHERFFACDGDAIFSAINCHVAGARGYTSDSFSCRHRSTNATIKKKRIAIARKKSLV